jgi:apolipoprotein N-acyltransferase
VVDPYGRVTDSLPLSVEGVLDSNLPVAVSQTVYGRMDTIPLTATLVICLMALIVRERRRFSLT